ncbi:unnamed protein product [Kuraishia capsulata CBS 1993]|uniref:NAD+ kinase n=1 Tax=Kuraishia capsulata CBS 1993 TaxID=1382522 RepID=W6MQI9_9ASCO|nr:uncharacterized protein KUCA_T00004577001 [Kuraishia capsulata CBS 1993]CDK28593.1 unnamed protein product [Kuraishia capsulata CBS 1993]
MSNQQIIPNDDMNTPEPAEVTSTTSSSTPSPIEGEAGEEMQRSDSFFPKQPVLHGSLYCDDNPRCALTDEKQAEDIPASTALSPMLKKFQQLGLTNQVSPPRKTKRNASQDLLNLSKNDLKAVKSHAQLAKTANGVRILARNLDKATIKIQLRSVMIVTKARDNSLVYLTRELTEWLLRFSENNFKLDVYVDYHLETSKRFHAEGIVKEIPNSKDRLKYWDKALIRANPELFDLVLTLGGDGTVLYASTLFQRVVPPVMSFSLGSLGFLTNFKFEDFRKLLHNAVVKGVRTNLRMRFTCRVHAANGKLLCEQQVLNELTVDRGPSPWVSMLELYGDNSLLTVAQADGLIIATPTGSTAYSLSAGGSLVHPSVSAISVTPICPHTLSFRPILLPDSMVLKVKVPLRSRSTAWASFDGRSRVELLKGYYVTIAASPFPFPTVRSSKTEYFDSVSRVLNWNSREEQKSFVHLLSDKNKKSYNKYEQLHKNTEVAKRRSRAVFELDSTDSLKPQQGTEDVREDVTEEGEDKDYYEAEDDEDESVYEIDYNDEDDAEDHLDPTNSLAQDVPDDYDDYDESSLELDENEDYMNNYFHPMPGEEICTPQAKTPGDATPDGGAHPNRTPHEAERALHLAMSKLQHEAK